MLRLISSFIITFMLLCLNLNAVTSTTKSINFDEQTPVVLSPKDSKIYEEIFLLQSREKIKEADKLVAKLDNNILVSYVLANKYLSASYRTKFSELDKWFKAYPKHALSRQVYTMAQKKFGAKKASKLSYKRPSSNFEPIYMVIPDFKDQKSSKNAISDYKISKPKSKTEVNLIRYLKNGKTYNAKQILLKKNTRNTIGKQKYYHYTNLLARHYFLDGQYNFAIEWAEKTIKGAGNKLPSAYYTAGLSYWRVGDFRKAENNFSHLAKGNFTDTLKSSGAYWSARVNLKLNRIDQYVKYLDKASYYSYTFYGLIALEELQKEYSFDRASDLKSLRVDELKLLPKTPAGQRAFALLQLNLTNYAEQEVINLLSTTIRTSDKQTKIAYYREVYELANRLPMPHLRYRLAGNLGKKYGFNDLSYPVVLWDIGGYEIEPSLILAIIRKESGFNSAAVSQVGAKGLMQLMPATAKMVFYNANASDYMNKSLSLHNPYMNVAMGQDYLKMLINNPSANGNLIYVLAGWNGGFLHVKRWQNQNHRMKEDPLFFIESIPFRETRNFVKSTLRDYWIYQTILGDTPYTIHSIIKNQQPIYGNRMHSIAQMDTKTFNEFKKVSFER